MGKLWWLSYYHTYYCWWSLNRCETGTFVHASVCFPFFVCFFVSSCLVLSVASWGSVNLAVSSSLWGWEISLFLWKTFFLINLFLSVHKKWCFSPPCEAQVSVCLHKKCCFFFLVKLKFLFVCTINTAFFSLLSSIFCLSVRKTCFFSSSSSSVCICKKYCSHWVWALLLVRK